MSSLKSVDVILIRNADRAVFGGAERYQILLAQELINNQKTVLVASGHPGILEQARTRGVATCKTWWWKKQNFHGWRIVFTPIYVLWQIVLYLQYLNLFKKYQPQVVHLQSRDDFIAGTLAAHRLGIRVIWTDHADLKHLFLNTSVRLKNPIGKMILKSSAKANQIILVAKSEQQEIAKSLPETHPFWQKTKLVYNGVVDEFRPHQPQANFIFGLASRMVVDKGVAEAIEAFNKLSVRHPKTELWLLGDGPNLTEFKSLAKHNSQIKFFGHQKAPLKFLAKFDCFLQPTHHEALSISLLEACMMQLAIIATNVGGNPEIIQNDVNGWLIPPKNPAELIVAMEQVLADPTKRQQIAKQARHTFTQKFDFSQIVKQQMLPIYFD